MEIKAKEIKITPNRDYATRENALRAVAQCPGLAQDPGLRFIVLTTDQGRYYPCFLGESAVQAGAHFKFCVLG